MARQPGARSARIDFSRSATRRRPHLPQQQRRRTRITWNCLGAPRLAVRGLRSRRAERAAAIYTLIATAKPTTSIRRPGSPTCCAALPIIRPRVSPNCFPGTGGPGLPHSRHEARPLSAAPEDPRRSPPCASNYAAAIRQSGAKSKHRPRSPSAGRRLSALRRRRAQRPARGLRRHPRLLRNPRSRRRPDVREPRRSRIVARRLRPRHARRTADQIRPRPHRRSPQGRSCPAQEEALTRVTPSRRGLRRIT